MKTRRIPARLAWIAPLLVAAAWSACEDSEIVEPPVPIETAVSVVTVDSLLQGVPTKWAWLRWHGSHQGGAATRFIYAFLPAPDTITSCAGMWNPASNADDLAAATATTDTELWIHLKEASPASNATTARTPGSFFFVAALDDEGRVDPTPACAGVGEEHIPQPPETDIAVTVVDSLLDGVPTRWAHIMLAGSDDGAVVSWIYLLRNDPDSTATCEELWSPAHPRNDEGTITSDPDVWVRLTDPNPVSGAPPVNDWVFLASAIDNEGLIDPTPACETLGERFFEPPKIFLTQYVDDVAAPANPTPVDTVGYMKPFGFSYHGWSPNGGIAQYWWEFRSALIPEFPGEAEWTSNIADTLRSFENLGFNAFPPGDYTLYAKVVDTAGQASPEGAAAVHVNFPPETRFTGLTNTYRVGGQMFQRSIDFNDAVPDTVPYGSWLRLEYEGWDDDRDGTACPAPLVNTDRCVNFQIRYERESSRIPGSIGAIAWTPGGDTYDSDITSAQDTNSVNIGSVEYNFFARTVDEAGAPDPTPPAVSIVGNYDPVLKALTLEDHLGNAVDVSGAAVDTLTWNFWKGVGWPYTSILDTMDFNLGVYVKTFEWRLSAMAADHPLEADQGVRSWQYFVRDDNGQYWPLARSGYWFDGANVNAMEDVFSLTFHYGDIFSGTGANGDEVFNNLPGYFNRDLTIVALKGRDRATSDTFDQFMFYGAVAGQQATDNINKVLLNSYPTGLFGRWTEERTFTFHFRMVR